LLTQEGAEVEAEIVDHSSQGARVLVEKPIQLGTVVRLVVGSDQFSGLVRYCTREDGRGKYTVGVRLE
jgi:hypothetical protein